MVLLSGRIVCHVWSGVTTGARLLVCVGGAVCDGVLGAVRASVAWRTLPPPRTAPDGSGLLWTALVCSGRPWSALDGSGLRSLWGSGWWWHGGGGSAGGEDDGAGRFGGGCRTQAARCEGRAAGQ